MTSIFLIGASWPEEMDGGVPFAQQVENLQLGPINTFSYLTFRYSGGFIQSDASFL